METDSDRDDARLSWFWSIDAARAYADYFVVARFLVCSDFRFRIDRRNAYHVRTDRFAVRVQLKKIDSPPPGTTNSRGSLQHLLRYLVCVQSLVNRVNLVILV